MKGRNILLSKMKKTLLIICVILISTITQVYATETTENENGTESSEPYIEMKVTSRKKGENNQILVEMYGSKFKDLQAIETVFTYDSTKLTPSNIETNEPLDLTTIKYDQRPAYYEKPITDAEQNEVDNFNKESLNILSNSYTTNTNYSEQLGVSAFLFLAPNENTEALQFLLKNKKSTPNITSEEKVLLGTFSFTQTAGTKIEENEFSVRRIKISCLDLNSEDGIAQYERSKIVEDKIPSDKCEELMEFIYEQYGSISGTIETVYYFAAKDTYETMDIKKIATISLYNLEDEEVAKINWNSTGTEYYTYRQQIKPNIEGGISNNLARPANPDTAKIKPVMSITTQENDKGIFKLENIPFGKYVLLIDKLDFSDYIVTNITIDATNKDIDIGTAQIEAGDFNKTGTIDLNDPTIFAKLYAKRNELQNENIDVFDLNDDGAITDNDITIGIRVLSKMGRTVKQVRDYSEMK